jgi:hypothetical protein
MQQVGGIGRAICVGPVVVGWDLSHASFSVPGRALTDRACGGRGSSIRQPGSAPLGGYRRAILKLHEALVQTPWALRPACSGQLDL